MPHRGAVLRASVELQKPPVQILIVPSVSVSKARHEKPEYHPAVLADAEAHSPQKEGEGWERRKGVQ